MRQSDAPTLAFADRDAWEAFVVRANDDADAAGVWLQIAKAASGITTVTYDEALEVALCHGWIDGQKRRLDDDYYLQRFTPRRARSIWSQRNREAAEALIAGGAMAPAGLREVERARADGRWEAAYPRQSEAGVPDDLAAALAAAPGARAFFDGLDSRNRYSILHRVHNAKRPDTRARRIEQFAAMCAAGETLYPQRRRG
jgi:uncharacterized protein YdeI (YjbR/CyaY-like superfamily)